ncbi:nucleolar GTP-binding protein 1-domain-containing protein [Trametes maxima]|nr:nucleolar GTP-binding protein 1-domain-containing protein [Trametes maxima]
MLNRSETYKSNSAKNPGRSGRHTLHPSESSLTLVGSALERKMRDEDPITDRQDTGSRLESLRSHMRQHDLAYYVIPSQDSHGSKYIAPSDKRRKWIYGFTCTAGQAIVSATTGYLITHSRYWLQAREQLNQNWALVQAGSIDSTKTRVDWIVERAENCEVGIDAPLIAYEQATALNNALKPKNTKLYYSPQNLVDPIWRDQPTRSRKPIYVQRKEFAGSDQAARIQVATLISNLSCIAWMLNLRGDDIPFNPVFHSYLLVGIHSTSLFIELAKITPEVHTYLQPIGVAVRDHNDIWTFLCRKEPGEGNVIVSPQTSYAICLMLTTFRCTVFPSYVEEMKAVKNETELRGLRNVYVRDGAAFVRWLAWLEEKMGEGYDVTEWEVALYHCKQLKCAVLGCMATIVHRQNEILEELEESSFINKVTRGDVDVQPYVFTTKSLFVGHLDHRCMRWQVIVTPRILDHPLEMINIEMQSITALVHLKVCILYFMDLSEQCGYSVEAQCQLFHSIKPLFANKPCVLVINKGDIVHLEDLSPERRALVDEIIN